jgi:hypothetical protein
MGAGVTEPVDGESYAAGAAPQRSGSGWWRDLRRPLAYAGVLASSLFVVMAASGIGTGPGPLGDCCGYGVGVSRDVGVTITEGNVIILNRGWFPVELEEVRPLPSGRAGAGLRVTAVEVADLPLAGAEYGTIGLVTEEGYQHVSRERRHLVRGFVIQPQWRVGKDRGLAEVLVRYQVAREGTWVYHGYEVTYRSGLVRHRAVLDLTVAACAPQSRFPDGCAHD